MSIKSFEVGCVWNLVFTVSICGSILWQCYLKEIPLYAILYAQNPNGSNNAWRPEKILKKYIRSL